jgi:hypothetical protein
VFQSVEGMFWASADGAHRPEPLTKGRLQTPFSFTSDGKRLFYFEQNASNGALIQSAEVRNDSGRLQIGQPQLFLETSSSNPFPAVSYERLLPPRVAALEGSSLQSFAYDCALRLLEIEFRARSPFAFDEIPLPPPPHVIRYFNVPRYIVTRLTRHRTGRGQDQYWASRHPNSLSESKGTNGVPSARIWRFREAKNIRRFHFEEYMTRLAFVLVA